MVFIFFSLYLWLHAQIDDGSAVATEDPYIHTNTITTRSHHSHTTIFSNHYIHLFTELFTTLEIALTLSQHSYTHTFIHIHTLRFYSVLLRRWRTAEFDTGHSDRFDWGNKKKIFFIQNKLLHHEMVRTGRDWMNSWRGALTKTSIFHLVKHHNLRWIHNHHAKTIFCIRLISWFFDKI